MHLPLILVVASTLGAARAASEANQVWLGVKDGRERLHSGIYRAAGRTKSGGEANVDDLNGEVTIFCAFDDSAGMLRFDRVCPVRWLPGAPGPKDSPSKEQVAKFEVRYIGAPSQSMTWTSLGMGVVVSPPGKRSADESQALPFDVRQLGLITTIHSSQPHSFDELWRSWSERPIQQVAREADGIVRLTWGDRGDDAEWRVRRWIDTAHGYTIIRSEHEERAIQAAGAAEWPAPHLIAEVSWVQVSAVWVPTAFVLHRQSRTDELSFDWESVNEDIPNGLFTAKGLGVDPWTLVTDVRLGKPIIVGHVEEPPLPPPSPSKGRAAWFYPVIVVNVVVLALIAMVMLWRRLAR
ncbi:MAG TPA: hypothetical protein VF278_01535 [Pirellulales bacterium]